MQERGGMLQRLRGRLSRMDKRLGMDVQGLRNGLLSVLGGGPSECSNKRESERVEIYEWGKRKGRERGRECGVGRRR